MIVPDGCCGAGGATRGYVDAGHEVWGSDIAPQPNYLKSGAAGFQQTDILQALREPWTARVDFIHVSPPCQFYGAMSRARPGVAAKYPDLIGPVRELLNATGKPWVIENVVAARPWMKDPVLLCAQMFRPGILLYRHRLFETGGGSPWRSRRSRVAGYLTRTRTTSPATAGCLRSPSPAWPAGSRSNGLTRATPSTASCGSRMGSSWTPAACTAQANTQGGARWCRAPASRAPDGTSRGVLADAQRLLRSIEPGRRKECGWPHPVPASRAGHWVPGKFVSVAGHERVCLTRKVMAIDWTNREELAEAIPPYFTRWIGGQLSGPRNGCGPGDRRATPAERQDQ